MPAISLILALPHSDITALLGTAMARSFPGPRHGAVVYLQGELGSGKTCCARSLLQTLGVSGPVRSPTYTLLDTYELPGLTCVHVDLYRMLSPTEVLELGLRDLTGAGFLMLIEWPEKGHDALPPADLVVALRYSGEARAASLSGYGEVGSAWVAKLALDNSLTPYVSNLT